MNIPAPTALASTTDPAALQLKGLYLATGRSLVNAKCWPQLKRNYSFTTSDGVYVYDLPPDFDTYILETAWDRTNQRRLGGPLSDIEYNRLKYGIVNGPNYTCFRIFGRNTSSQIDLFPIPGDTDLTISFDYLSSGWIYDSGTTNWQTEILADTNTCAFDDEIMILGLKYRWLQAKGLDYQAYQIEFNQQIQTAQARWQGNVRVSLAPSDGYFALNIPEGSWNI